MNMYVYVYESNKECSYLNFFIEYDFVFILGSSGDVLLEYFIIFDFF